MTLSDNLTTWLQRLDRSETDASIRAFVTGDRAFIAELLPELAVQLPGVRVMKLLRERLGSELLSACLGSDYQQASPLEGLTDTSWIRSANLVGINVRTISHFWNVVKYSLTLPASQSAIHLLPIWEPGVVASLYGMSSRNINPEFFSEELATLCPHLSTVEVQLRAVINLLHALGRTVGMDVIPHTDRYAEIVLANPQHFEWLQRFELEIVDHAADLHLQVQDATLEFLAEHGPASAGLEWPAERDDFYADTFGETRRNLVLFGEPSDQDGRNRRRGELVNWLFNRGYEPVPATMGPPYRGLEVDPRPEARSVDHLGRIWCEYRIHKPQVMSRVFGPLTRYKFYERLDDNADWQIDFSQPRTATWSYFQEFYARVQREYQFDFMRGDMSHVQMRPKGVPTKKEDYYDPHQMVGKYIRQTVPYFAYFAETFLVAPDIMAYGDELDHLEMSDADATLGDLQSVPVGDWEFMRHFRWYLDLLATRRFAPSFTIMTGDKDDPRFDKFYLDGNEARLFIALFLPDMPSYMALGFEQRDPHPEPVANEYYTKLYVFLIDQGSKAVTGPYQWGDNLDLFARLHRIRLQADQLWPETEGRSVRWLIYPNPAGTHFVIAWEIVDTPYLCVVNLDTQKVRKNVKIPLVAESPNYRLIFSTHKMVARRHRKLPWNGLHLQITQLKAGEGRIYRRDED
ncbi:hypothetical protein [Flavilitoribacter nigricans]|uniref:Uncharacterized protein n=1 Tax=Flavilitoribacter nigricans (strain ATCC 23147 / DSM 23189 / NBRC 102662 / NCIMB 1420 / SS-2) TaxID=1122177 RepID=A0A2D0N984_FLAN2|nr:hypothetical protein [Flavilitoribacter nigricans]PHN05082.1 hypothetical protein CRP01_18840 [Flavilitoribacter nigricans DSM 23189 = NBRC 102662]